MWRLVEFGLLLAANICLIMSKKISRKSITTTEPNMNDHQCVILNDTARQNLIRDLLNSSRYDPNTLPEPGLEVTVEITIQDITEINEMTSSFKLDLWFSQIWRDHRLDFSAKNYCSANLSLPESALKNLWVPNVCIVNSKETHIHSSPSANILLLLMENGTVWLNYRVRITGKMAKHK